MAGLCVDLRELKKQLKEAVLRFEEAQEDPESAMAELLWLCGDIVDLMGRVNSARQDDDTEEDDEEFWRDMDNDPWDDEPRSDVVDEEE